MILFTGDPQDLALRVVLTGRDDYTAERLERMQKDLCRLYRGAGVITIDIRGMAVRDVTKKVAEMIFFDDYREYQLSKKLRRYI